MSIEAVRDWVLIIAGILWGIITLGVAIITGGVAYFTRKGLRAGNDALTDQVRPALAGVHARLAAVRDRTAQLPGNTPLLEVEGRPVRGAGLPRVRNLFKRRKRRRLPFLR